tara:strand:- start:880 stop:1014 length:135 start_codon:yes stop_codon:yes gene_type:complete
MDKRIKEVLYNELHTILQYVEDGGRDEAVAKLVDLINRLSFDKI